MTTSPIDEIIRQHVFIEAWLSGSDDAPPESFAERFDAALDPGFSMVSPDGSVTDRAALLDGFHRARGAVPGLRIEIRAATVVDTCADRSAVRYEEWQFEPDATSVRVSTALLAPDSRAPIGWSWRSLHETWLTATAAPDAVGQSVS